MPRTKIDYCPRNLARYAARLAADMPNDRGVLIVVAIVINWKMTE